MKWLGDEDLRIAEKIAGHELKGLSSFINTPVQGKSEKLFSSHYTMESPRKRNNVSNGMFDRLPGFSFGMFEPDPH